MSSRSRRRFALASAFASLVALAGCQAILGIDPDSRHDAVADQGDSASLDGAFLDAPRADTGLGTVLDAGSPCQTNAQCAPLAHAVCDQGICVDGACEVVPSDGLSCGTGGTCRQYACIGSTTQVVSAGDTSCAIALDGVVWCWGGGPSGILGDRGSTARSTPYVVPRIADDLPPAIQISLGHAHGCAVLADQSLVCWGSDAFGQATATDAGVAVVGPSVIAQLAQVDVVAAGFGHTCAASAGLISCWGDNAEGEIGGGPGLPTVVPAPTQVVGLSGAITRISSAWKTVCALVDDAVACWGDNTWSQLGTAVGAAYSPTPGPIEGLDHGFTGGVTVSDVVASWGDVCVIVSGDHNERVPKCLGNNRNGQLGNHELLVDAGEGGPGDVAHDEPSPVVTFDDDTYPQLEGAELLFAGTGTNLCIRLKNATDLYCAGRDAYGELGYPSPGIYTAATPMPQTGGASLWALGDAHACDLFHDVDGWNVFCVGNDDEGQLGNGTNVAEDHPRPVKFPSAAGGLANLRKSQ